MAHAGQLPIEEMNQDEFKIKQERRGLALNLLKADTVEKKVKVKMVQHLHQSLSGAEEVLRKIRQLNIEVSGAVLVKV